MNEASKTRAVWGDFELSILKGNGIDIGCGLDPVFKEVKPFDLADGDANVISKYVTDQYDYVFSAHCLEHMHNPAEAIKEWWKLVKPGGYLFFIVPDEDLYEQGYFPSFFNTDHKNTFTINKNKSWSKKSVNILELIKNLDDFELIDIRVQNNNYNHKLNNHSKHSYKAAFFGVVWWSRLRKVLKMAGINVKLMFIVKMFNLPYDQTMDAALAQIQTIVRKKVE